MTVAALSHAKPAADSLEEEKEKKWREQLSRDFYLREAVNVLNDISPKGPSAPGTASTH
jgi:hypothetical protein